MAGGAAEVLPVSLNCPAPATSKNPPPYISLLFLCFCSDGSTSTKSGRLEVNLSLSGKRGGTTTATLCVSPPFSCFWRLLPSSWFSSASSVLRSLNSVLYLDPFLFPGFLSLVPL